jgi:hypothetical protein
MSETKIVLITPPPIDGPETQVNSKWTQEEVERMNQIKKSGQRYRTYMSKKRYAEGVMEIAKEYEETGRVVGLDFWRRLVEESGKGKWEEFEETGLWPGSGLVGARSFDEGWFTDGLHMDRNAYGVLSRMLTEKMVESWPELGVESL